MKRISREIRFFLLFSIYILIFACCLALQSTDATTWISRWFSDKTYVFLFSSVYLWGLSLFMNDWGWAKHIRIGSRKKILLLQMSQAYCSACVSINILFFFLIIGGTLIYKDVGGSNQDLALQYIRYLLGYFLISNISLIFQLFNIPLLNQNSHFLTFALLVMEVLVIYPSLRKNFEIKFPIIFSWVFYGGAKGAFFLGVLFFISLVVIIAIAFLGKRDVL